jgi:hypothetical protein
VDRVERHGQQHQIPSELPREALLKHAEVVREPQAEVRQRATGVNEIDRDHLPAQAGELHVPPLLVGQREIRHRLADRQRFHRARLRDEVGEQLQPIGGEGVLLHALISHDADAFGARGVLIDAERELDDGAGNQAVEILRLAHLEGHGHRAHVSGDRLNRRGERVAGAIHGHDHAGHRILLRGGCRRALSRGDQGLGRENHQQYRCGRTHQSSLFAPPSRTGRRSTFL